MTTRKIVFLTGTRADYGKMKPLMDIVERSSGFESSIFITGMHTMSKYGSTLLEVKNDGYSDTHVYMNQIDQEPMDLVLANTINGLSRYVREVKPDMLVIHGDRLETLAGAIVGAFNNILVAHVEGGEVSGTIDESIRHSVSKLSHLHFVSNNDAKNRLIQLGESSESINVIGSPDYDLLVKKSSLPIDKIKERYGISFEKYAIGIFHPDISELHNLDRDINNFIEALKLSGDNYVMIYPNNDLGNDIIVKAYEGLKTNGHFKIFPSIRFEYFLELIRNADYLIGNSSAGIHETSFLGVPSINVGNRQKNRFSYKSIINCRAYTSEILESISIAKKMVRTEGTEYFGKGESANNFIEVLKEEKTWSICKQKVFRDMNQS